MMLLENPRHDRQRIFIQIVIHNFTAPSMKILFVLTLSLICSAICAQNQEKTPNIILILADDLGYGDVSVYNEHAAFKTPHIDRLAEKGVAFTHAYTSSSVCTPTRYGILTGRYNWRSTLKKSVLSGYSKSLIPADRITLADVLLTQGYYTGFIGKWHLGWDWQFKGDAENINNLSSQPEVDFSKPIENGPEALGFKYSYGFSGSLDMPPYVYVENSLTTKIPVDTTVNYDEKGFWRKGITAPDLTHVDVLPHLTGKAVDYINERATADQPFFLYYALPAPHTPILPITEFVGKSNTNLYGDFVLQVDDVVGQITETLEQHGILDETIVIFTSDNGPSPRSDFDELARAGHDPTYIFRGHKADIYEGGLRVPFLVSWPEAIPQSISPDEVVSTVDFMSTFAELSGYSMPDNAGEDSHSFLPVLRQESYEKPLREATVLHSIDGRFAIVKDKWKLILWPGSGGWSDPRTAEELEGLPPFQLYNLEDDPSEQNNLVNQYPEMVEALKTLLEEYIVKGRSNSGTPQKNDGPQTWPQLEWVEN